MSYPHFYGADDYFINQVEGMKPSKEKHEFFMTFEPVSDLILNKVQTIKL
jgi:hypothetical protein